MMTSKKLTSIVVMSCVAAMPIVGTAIPESPQQTCRGQASKVFAQTGAMGEHASQQPSPRLGLRNPARALYEAGVIPDDSMYSLGVFVSYELELSIDACMTMP